MDVDICENQPAYFVVQASKRTDNSPLTGANARPDVVAGVTFPTGKPPDSFANPAQEIDTTGAGVFQASGAIALEQIFGPWLVNATGLLAVRSARSGEQLAPQGTFLAATAYTFPNDMALALSASYAFEGDASDDGTPIHDSSKRALVVTFSGFWPVTDTWRLLGGLYLDPPFDGLGTNQPTVGGLTFTVIPRGGTPFSALVVDYACG